MLLFRAEDRVEKGSQAETFELVHVGLLRFQPTPMRSARLLGIVKVLPGLSQHRFQFSLRPNLLSRPNEPCIDLVEH